MFQKVLSPFAESSYALLRIVTGLMFSFHGMQKILGVMNTQGTAAVGSQMWFGGLIELVCGLLIAFGFLASPAAFLASGTMAVAYSQFHWKFRFDNNFFPAEAGGNGGELALAYAFLFLFIACKGAGKWSVDAKMAKRGDSPS